MHYRKCRVPGCKSLRQDDVKLHKFPICPKRLQKWLETINCSSLRARSYVDLRKLLVCHKHFEARFLTEKGRLTCSSYPTLFTKEEISSGIPSKSHEAPENIYPKEHNYTKRCHYDHTYAHTMPSDQTRAYVLADPIPATPEVTEPVMDLVFYQLSSTLSPVESSDNNLQQFTTVFVSSTPKETEPVIDPFDDPMTSTLAPEENLNGNMQQSIAVLNKTSVQRAPSTSKVTGPVFDNVDDLITSTLASEEDLYDNMHQSTAVINKMSVQNQSEQVTEPVFDDDDDLMTSTLASEEDLYDNMQQSTAVINKMSVQNQSLPSSSKVTGPVFDNVDDLITSTLASEEYLYDNMHQSTAVINKKSVQNQSEPSTSKVTGPDNDDDQMTSTLASEEDLYDNMQQSTAVLNKTSIKTQNAFTCRKRIIPNIKSLSPDCMILYKEYRKAKKMLSFHSRARKAMKFSKKASFEKLTSKMNPLAKQIMWMQVKLQSKEKKGRRFTEEDKLLALSIMKQGEKCYKFLQQIFILPCTKTLKKLEKQLSSKSSDI